MDDEHERGTPDGRARWQGAQNGGRGNDSVPAQDSPPAPDGWVGRGAADRPMSDVIAGHASSLPGEWELRPGVIRVQQEADDEPGALRLVAHVLFGSP